MTTKNGETARGASRAPGGKRGAMASKVSFTRPRSARGGIYANKVKQVVSMAASTHTACPAHQPAVSAYHTSILAGVAAAPANYLTRAGILRDNWRVWKTAGMPKTSENEIPPGLGRFTESIPASGGPPGWYFMKRRLGYA